ncbi:acyl-CoA thioesterase [Actinocorallia sp. A-T 12471]|uniref:acyl-CoA thioesterase n=1 Tax=Actinocorallia sp. A-T 12471 TaxID=3089813 RepID=UPI0029CE473A|nr:acyl-CoA thioesterase domain-containing protein [Actinocorallia sp. A-T 12471]MDX6741362.1 thioesterase family protein [Actinocorallia sp. A-T 12471]
MSESTLLGLLDVFDVTALDDLSYEGGSDAGGRQVVDGSQLLAQSVVAAAKAFPDLSVRTAQAMFATATRPDEPISFTVAPLRAGSSFVFATVTAAQGGVPKTTVNVLLDRPQPDVVRRDRWTGPPPQGPEAAYDSPMPLPGRTLRIEGVRDRNDPAETGPPLLDAWLRYLPIPDRADLRRALLAHFTGHLSIATTLRAHPGIGPAQAHHTLSTAPLTISVHFHEPVEWDGWLRYHHESTYVGAGMSHVRGQILTRGGRLLASFTQDAMIRTLGERAAAVPAAARL